MSKLPNIERLADCIIDKDNATHIEKLLEHSVYEINDGNSSFELLVGQVVSVLDVTRVDKKIG